MPTSRCHVKGRTGCLQFFSQLGSPVCKAHQVHPSSRYIKVVGRSWPSLSVHRYNFSHTLVSHVLWIRYGDYGHCYALFAGLGPCGWDCQLRTNASPAKATPEYDRQLSSELISSKCDEAKPFCRPCQRRKLGCSLLRYILLPRPARARPSSTSNFQNPSSQWILPNTGAPNPTNKLSSLPIQITGLDRELLHFYKTTTSHEILGQHMTGTHIWRASIIALSFQYPFLLSALLSLSALHLGKHINAAMLHHARRISEYRLEIQNLNAENSDACCATAWFLALISWATPDGQGSSLFFSDGGAGSPVAWYKLHRGGNEVLNSAAHWLENGAL
ncbi:hypothetical protein BDZ45DRAFT_809896 [Acephala macrosclerotiorum]|nr:hypothetical protein BDZ45DRAFT_809896 [Acephala macrosclerotiorum]